MGLHNDGGSNDVVAHCERLCADYGVDVIALQEAWDFGRRSSTMTRRVAVQCGGELHEYIWPDEANNTFPARWTIATIARVKSTRLDGMELTSAFGKKRAAMRIRLDDHGLVFTNGHLEGIHALLHRQPATFMRQRRELSRLAATSDIFVGDFNMWPPLVHRDAAPLTPTVKGRTWPATRPHSQIDHIMVSDRLEVIDARVLDDLGSDHRPIMARLRVID